MFPFAIGLPINRPEHDLSSVLNRPMTWGMRDIYDQHAADAGPFPRNLLDLENNYLLDAPWLQYWNRFQQYAPPVSARRGGGLLQFLHPQDSKKKDKKESEE